MAESVRVQMSKKTIDELTSLSEIYGCMYAGKPSFSKLLDKIGEKHLSVRPTNLNVRENKIPLLLISIDTPYNLTGIVATIIQKIDKCEGKIIRAEAKLKRKNLGNLKICLSPPTDWENGFMVELINAVNIDFKALKDFGNSESQKHDAYILLLEEGKTKVLEGDIIKQLDNESVNLLIDLSLVFGLKLTIDPKSNALVYFTTEVAKKGVLISSIRQDFSCNETEEAFDFFLEIKTNSSNIKEISETINFLKSCEGVSGIIHTEYLLLTKNTADELFSY